MANRPAGSRKRGKGGSTDTNRGRSIVASEEENGHCNSRGRRSTRVGGKRKRYGEIGIEKFVW